MHMGPRPREEGSRLLKRLRRVSFECVCVCDCLKRLRHVQSAVNKRNARLLQYLCEALRTTTARPSRGGPRSSLASSVQISISLPKGLRGPGLPPPMESAGPRFFASKTVDFVRKTLEDARETQPARASNSLPGNSPPGNSPPGNSEHPVRPGPCTRQFERAVWSWTR